MARARSRKNTVREMLGLVDRSLCFDILDAVMQGDAPTALALLDEQYAPAPIR